MARRLTFPSRQISASPSVFDELGELRERNPLDVGRAHGEGAETRDRIMVLGDTDDEVESALPLEDFAHHASLRGRLDDVLHVLHVDAVPRRRGAILDDLELGCPNGHSHDSHLRELEQPVSDLPDVRSHCLDRDPDRELGPNPQVSFVQLREEFLSEQREHEKRTDQTGCGCSCRHDRTPGHDATSDEKDSQRQRDEALLARANPMSRSITVRPSSARSRLRSPPGPLD
jgi:hypothetical protein